MIFPRRLFFCLVLFFYFPSRFGWAQLLLLIRFNLHTRDDKRRRRLFHCAKRQTTSFATLLDPRAAVRPCVGNTDTTKGKQHTVMCSSRRCTRKGVVFSFAKTRFFVFFNEIKNVNVLLLTCLLAVRIPSEYDKSVYISCLAHVVQQFLVKCDIRLFSETI